MPPERWSPDDPREWLNRARSNLLRAQVTLPGVYGDCFVTLWVSSSSRLDASVEMRRGWRLYD
jgi:hypothetical protein